MHICASNLTMIDSDNGLSPDRRQAFIWTNAGILLIGPLGTNLSEILVRIQTFSFKKMHLKMSSAKWRPFCLGLNVLSLTDAHMPQWTGTSLVHVTWPVACLAPSHYMYQWWLIVNLILMNRLQWNFNQNLHIFLQENAFKNVWKNFNHFVQASMCLLKFDATYLNFSASFCSNTIAVAYCFSYCWTLGHGCDFVQHFKTFYSLL